MKLSEYQRRAAATDQFPRRRRARVGEVTKEELVPLLGLTGEVGTLLSEYKKLLRDGPVHLRFQDRLAEELGDTLWYVAAVATKFGLSLDEIADANLRKVRDRWAKPPKRRPFDRGVPSTERLPVRFTYRFKYAEGTRGARGLALVDERGQQIGNLLTDNAHVEDGYRFHDVMHFAFVAMLGWSPVARKILGRKRRTNAKTDEVEDGGRASVIDEAIVAMVFDYVHHDLAGSSGLKRIDSETLRSIRALTRGFEVHGCTEAEWEEAILRGLKVWRLVDSHDGGVVIGDQVARTFAFRPPGRLRRTSAAERKAR